MSFAKQIADHDIGEVKHNKLLTPLVLDYRMRQGQNAQFTDEEGIAIVSQLLEEQNNRITSRAKRTSYSGGSAFSCMRKQALDVMIGNNRIKNVDYRLSLIFEDGNWRNLKWIVEFQRMGILKEYEKTSYNEEINLSWTPDARVDLSLYYGDEYSDVPVEIKGMNEWEFNQFRARNGKGRFAHSRIMQIHSYMLAEDKDHWLIFAENKNNQDIEEYWCERDENIISLLKNKYAYMLDAQKRNALPAIECTQQSPDRQFLRCDRSQECLEKTENTHPSLRQMKNKKELEEKAKRAFV